MSTIVIAYSSTFKAAIPTALGSANMSTINAAYVATISTADISTLKPAESEAKQATNCKSFIITITSTYLTSYWTAIK